MPQTIFVIVLLFCYIMNSPFGTAADNIGYQNPSLWMWESPSDKKTIPIKTIDTRQKEDEPPDSNPCKREIISAVPDFKILRLHKNARKSEQKCVEYIWLMKYRSEKEDKDRQCFLHTLRSIGAKNLVIGGQETSPGEFPHMAAIGWKTSVGTWSFKCGGSLISDKFVLTAAHCTSVSDRDSTVADPVPKIVRLGDKNIADIFSNGLAPIDVNITRIFTHPLYQPPITYNDVALLQLEKPVEFSKYVQPACLWSKFDTSVLGNEAIVTGWGVIDSASLKSTSELQKATLDIIHPERCNQLLNLCNRKWCGLQDNQICAGKETGGIDSCQGDSGGPLQVKIALPLTTQGNLNYIIGVTSFGRGCALANTPGVYARVSTFIDWIESIVWPPS